MSAPRASASIHTGALRAGVFLGLLLALLPVAPVHAAAPVTEAEPVLVEDGTPLLAPPGARPVQEDLPPAIRSDEAGQPPVVQAGDPASGAVMTRRPTFESPPPAAADGGYLYTQIQQLQEEIMALRGLVEAQRNDIDRLQREQRDRYIDLDRRLSLVTSGAIAPVPGEIPGSAAEGGEASLSEQQAYERAFALTRERDFPGAIEAFRQQLDGWPDGQYAGNAFYWLGEIYLAQDEPDLEMARQQFMQVLNLFPDHRKVPDTLYKLGVVYDRLGEPDEARRYLDRVREEHAGSPAAKLAASYSARLSG